MRSKLIFYYKTGFKTPVYVLYPLENKYWRGHLESPYDRMNLRLVTWVREIASAGIYR